MQCKELFEVIDSLSDRYLDMLEDVCNIESQTIDKEGVDKVGSYFAEEAKKHGWKVEIAPQEKSGDLVCITMNPDAKGEPVTISGHIDTVHPKGLFGDPPVHRDAEKIYGPGVHDCKGGCVAGLQAMDALERIGFAARPVRLILQSDEENSSKTSGGATVRYMCEKAKDSVAFLNLEPHVAGCVTLLRKGILRYKLTVHGNAVHSAVCYTGANAVTEAAHKLLQLERFKDENGLTCNCGVIRGGTVPNSVADTCEFYADFRFATNEQYEEAVAAVEEVAAHSTVEGCTCTAEVYSSRPAMIESEKNNDLLAKINEIYAENGLQTLEKKMGNGGSDAAQVTQAGIPCVDNFGSEGGRGHSKEEFTYLRSVSAAAKRIAAVIYCI
ncbi:MAG: M20/M25/M40 family metallo-hydrolase [Oscillospiraceae bacterium]|nr:M20/M25/M40 family metallo-hydrolase [Oscillospiraceae bacterium]MBR2365962.1 M20/M25/M40 family metallo-hydrolase [Oscillospiraceae bacterium]MBR2977398.1 M20/M25/M40 family metallo-hydrolase [Oscillospiraceae bacterium]